MLNYSQNLVERIISRPEFTINFCILAHVDHGKTTLCDHLISSNSIIGKELAGEILYMDCLPEERERNITMKASSVCLTYKVDDKVYFLNVVDSPGHVDFEAEVSNAVRMSDGCIILVDAVEGVSVQTEVVIRCAFINKLKPILVINKLDRLFSDLGLSPEDAELHLQQVIEEVNAATMAEFPPFDPVKGNVVFASCTGGYGFSIPSESVKWAEKLQLTPEKAADLFWGSKYWDPVTKMITKNKPSANTKTFFSQLFLTPIWRVYQSDELDLNSFASKLNVSVSAKDTAVNILAKWKPLSHTLLSTIINFLPTPIVSQPEFLPVICPEILNSPLKEFAFSAQKDCPVLAFGPKIVHGKLLSFPINKETKKEIYFPFVMYIRIYCGTISVGDKLYARHDRTSPVQEFDVEGLFLFIGNQLIYIQKASAGNVVGVGLRHPMLKQSTISSQTDFPVFYSITHNAKPIIKVSVEAEKLTDQESLCKSAEILAKIDSAVQVSNEDDGQLVLSCMGEVHLEYCINELQNYLTSVPFSVSEPIVPCKETVIAKSSPKEATVGTTTMCSQCFRAPDDVLDVMKDGDIEKIKEHLKGIKKYANHADNVIAIYPPNEPSNILICSQEYKDSFNSLIAGFRLLVRNGPLCGELLYGCIFIISKIEVKQRTLAYFLQDDDDEVFSSKSSLQFGETISCAKESLKKAFLGASPRIMEPLYKCDLQTDYSVVGKTYDIMSQHRCSIVEERAKEGTCYITIESYLPVIESFDFAKELRSGTSGKSHPHLVFSHFQLLEDDPFWKPVTKDEIEFYGVDGQEDKPNNAKLIIEKILKRKGLWTEKIEHKADRKATLSRTK